MRTPGIGERRRTDACPRLGIAKLRRVHEVAYRQVVALCRRVLEIRDRIYRAGATRATATVPGLTLSNAVLRLT